MSLLSLRPSTIAVTSCPVTGRRRSVAKLVDSLTEDAIFYDQSDGRGICNGDSGGQAQLIIFVVGSNVTIAGQTAPGGIVIMGGGLKVNDATVTDEKMVLTPAALTPEGVIKLSLGKKRHVLIKPQ